MRNAGGMSDTLDTRTTRHIAAVVFGVAHLIGKV
jgi:hypothetical protein